MKLKLYILILALSTWSLQSCDNDDDESISVPVELQNAFASKYPNARNVKWEIESGYYVADFHNGYDISAWFTSNGIWHMTETDIPYSKLPETVKSSFEKSEYKDWKKEDVDMFERQGLEIVYVIEVENQNQEVDLYYSEDGILIKTVVDTDDDQDGHLPVLQLSAEMKSFIEEKYPGARIMEVDKENFGDTEVDIIHEGISKEVVFNKENVWTSTSWDVIIIPVIVGTTISEQFPQYHIDDTEYFETYVEGNYYLIELEADNMPDKKVKITPEGGIL
ncbi:PepSY-like domain-containing protein [Bacteroides sp.]|uniref:PepSY-like domain-containing protein n=1 Tax=Bacteroides sp. TaxID=29523 RepID=UPI002601F975|nr:PepSY-like domain-containing protein [Bacteroides sp.]MDD3037656.1 PepSY-like domain-containing protein [Bacteroides sp.]